MVLEDIQYSTLLLPCGKRGRLAFRPLRDCLQVKKAAGLDQKVMQGTINADAAVSALLKEYGVKWMHVHG